MTKEEFIERFVARMLKASNAACPDGKFTDGSSIEEYARQTAPTYWDDEGQRDDGPEDCADADISYWEPE